MDRCRKHPIRHHPGLRYASVLCTLAMLNVLPGCVTMKAAPEMAWVDAVEKGLVIFGEQ
jgi:hypothetical protein